MPLRPPPIQIGACRALRGRVSYHDRIEAEGSISDEHTLEFLLAFDGRIHHLEQGYWLKFEIKRAQATPARPHGLRYAFTLHDHEGKRLVGFDNAHRVSRRRSPFGSPNVEHDHWHRTRDDPGRPYAFASADQLLADFFAEVRHALSDRGIDDTVVGVSHRTARSKP